MAYRFPSSTSLAIAPGFYVFVHASLVTEMFFIQRPCLGCLAVATLAMGAAVCQLRRNPKEWPASGIAIVLGLAAGIFTPLERVDDLATRTFWPARMLEAAPHWVSRDEMSRCAHPSALRMLIFEKDCKS